MPRYVQGVKVNKDVPPKAKIKVGHFFRKNSQGDNDVYRRLTYFDSDLGYTRSCGSKKIGAIPGSSTDLKLLIPLTTYEAQTKGKHRALGRMSVLVDLMSLDFRELGKIQYPLHIAIDGITLARLGNNTTAESTAAWFVHNRQFMEKRWGRDYPATDISKETIIRLISLIEASNFRSFYKEFVLPFTPVGNYDEPLVVAGDGQCIKATRSNRLNEDGKKTRPATAVSIFCTESGLYFDQLLVPGKTNEIPAFQELISDLDLVNCVVTLDAGHCFAETCRRIMCDARADYVISLKENQPTLHEAVLKIFGDGKYTEEGEYADKKAKHGRKDYRRIRIAPASLLGNRNKTWREWHGLLSGVLVEAYRKSTNAVTGEVTEGCRYFISSFSPERKDVLRHCARAVRHHWLIEEGHHCLDVDFNQDHIQAKNRTFIHNSTLLNKLAMAATTQFLKAHPGKRKTSLATQLKSQCQSAEVAAATLDWFVLESYKKKLAKEAQEQPLTKGSPV